jgi:outer membrane receptor protein involved in Fe transport
LDELVVVTHRFAVPVRESVAATSVLTRDDIARLPARSLPDVLRTLPGIVFVDRDGSGRLPMAIARGFFGGGEASYVLLTVDGVPLNDGRTGLVEWTQMPLSDIERVEVLRGSASEAYGDAALGAVVNVVTRSLDGGRAAEGGVSLGSWTGASAWGSVVEPLGPAQLRVASHYDRDDGQRAHSESSRLTSSATMRWLGGENTASTFARASFSRIANEEPGPLGPEALVQDRRGSHPAYEADQRTRSSANLTAGTARGEVGGRRLEAMAGLRWTDQERTRTLLLTPGFGDTQLLDDREVSAWGRVQGAQPLGGSLLRAGGEFETARYRTRYLDPSVGGLNSEGQAHRTKLALHTGIHRILTPGVRLHAGVRYDAVLPSEQTDGGASPSFQEWSPRVALNVAYSRLPSRAGNLFVSWTRAFKAPTMDQLFDPRKIPTGEPGQSFNISNADLKPQRSSAFEVGAYQRIPLGESGGFAELSAAAYRQDLEDEIDFDVRTYSYGNIQKSRHTGVEAGVRAVLANGLELIHSATHTRATPRSSPNEEHQLKNIPESASVTSALIGLSPSVLMTLSHRATGGVYLDDENTEKLEGSSLMDAGLTWRIGRIEASMSARNVFDTENESFGFLLFDPFQGADVRMVHPGPGRSLDLRITVLSR